jgi:hypothetical protein
MKLAIGLALALLALPALAGNEVGNGNIPPYVKWQELTKHAPFLADQPKAGDKIGYHLEHTHIQLKPEFPYPNIWNLGAEVEVATLEVTPTKVTLATTISSEWNGAAKLVVRDVLSWPDRTLTAREYCLPNMPCKADPNVAYHADHYKARDLAVGFGFGQPLFELKYEEPVTITTPAGPQDTTVRYYDAKSDLNGTEATNVLKTWESNTLPVAKPVKLSVIWKGNDGPNLNGDMTDVWSIILTQRP